MNWSTKILKGLVVLPALFFLFSCEDLNEIGSEINPDRQAISVQYLELPVESTQLSLRDSVLSSIRANRASLALGRFQDPIFGTTSASIYANIGLPGSLPELDNNAVADSVVLELYYENQPAGTVSGTQTFRVYPLSEPLAPTDTETVGSGDNETTLLSYNYSVDINPALEASSLGLLSFNRTQAQLDTLTGNARVVSSRLNKTLAEQLLTTLQNGDSVIRNDQRAFTELIGGLAIVPEENVSYTNSYRFVGGGNLPASRLVLYYTQGTENRSLNFPFSPRQADALNYRSFPAFTGIESDYTGTPLLGFEDQPFKDEFVPASGKVYYQPISGIRPRFSYQTYQDFINSDTLGLITINKAYLELDKMANQNTISELPGTRTPQANTELVASFLDNKNTFFAINDQLAIRGYTQGSDTLYTYRLDVTPFLQAYLEQGNESFLNLVLSPVESELLSMRNAVIDPEQAKLKIYYSEYQLD